MDARTRAALPTLTLDKARQLRRGMTDAERALWYHLRAGRLDGLKFRRQHPIPPYVVDFYCDAARLVIELDGSQHTQERDLHRTRFLESKGLTVLRFWNDDALLHTQAVLDAVWNIVGPRPLTPTPLPMGEGL